MGRDRIPKKLKLSDSNKGGEINSSNCFDGKTFRQYRSWLTYVNDRMSKSPLFFQELWEDNYVELSPENVANIAAEEKRSISRSNLHDFSKRWMPRTKEPEWATVQGQEDYRESARNELHTMLLATFKGTSTPYTHLMQTLKAAKVEEFKVYMSTHFQRAEKSEVDRLVSQFTSGLVGKNPHVMGEGDNPETYYALLCTLRLEILDLSSNFYDKETYEEQVSDKKLVHVMCTQMPSEYQEAFREQQRLKATRQNANEQ